MRRTSRLPFLLLATLTAVVSTSLACDATGSFGDTDTDPPSNDTDTDLDTDTPPPTVQGVQIGSEGIITTCAQRTVQDADTPAGFDLTAGDLRGLLSGTDTGVLSPDGAADVALGLQAQAGDVVAFDGPGCPDTVGIPLTLTVAADPALTASPAGWALIDPDGTGLFAAWDADWVGDAEPMFDPADYDTVELRVDGTVDANRFARGIDVGFEGCTAGVCDLEAYGTITLD